jgi:hypothetical protein
MGLFAMELFAAEARILLWLVIFFLLLFPVATLQLGALEFLVLACMWLAFVLRRVAVGAYVVCRFGVRGVGVLTHHCLEVGH